MIQIKNLQFRWTPTSPLVLDVPELNIPSGEAVFIKGPSGSGKSTLLNLIGGVLEPLDGELTVLGHDLVRATSHERDLLRGNEMGFIFQQFNLLPYLSVIENVTLPLKFSKQKSQKLAELQRTPTEEADRLLKALGMKTESLKSRPVTKLSVGQQQRVAAARALIGWPGLVIADEPTSALDADTRKKFVELLFQECRRLKATLVFVSHDGSLASLFDRSLDLTVINKAYSPEVC